MEISSFLHKLFENSIDEALPESELEEFAKKGKPEIYKKGEFFATAGDNQARIAFIPKGLFRIFLVSHEGKEVNLNFVDETSFLMDYYKILMREESPIYIEALEDSEVLVLEYKDIETFYKRSHQWERIGRLFTEVNFMYKAHRESELLLYTAIERYHRFMESQPVLSKRVSQKHIALYLGISPSTLNRLLKGKQ